MDIEKGNAHHICVDCHRQFLNDYQPYQRYSDEVRHECLKMYVNGMGFRGIEREIAGGIIPPVTLSRVKGVHHTTVISWVKAVGELLPNAYHPEQIPEVARTR